MPPANAARKLPRCLPWRIQCAMSQTYLGAKLATWQLSATQTRPPPPRPSEPTPPWSTRDAVNGKVGPFSSHVGDSFEAGHLLTWGWCRTNEKFLGVAWSQWEKGRICCDNIYVNGYGWRSKGIVVRLRASFIQNTATLLHCYISSYHRYKLNPIKTDCARQLRVDVPGQCLYQVSPRRHCGKHVSHSRLRVFQESLRQR